MAPEIPVTASVKPATILGSNESLIDCLTLELSQLVRPNIEMFGYFVGARFEVSLIFTKRFSTRLVRFHFANICIIFASLPEMMISTFDMAVSSFRGVGYAMAFPAIW